MDKKNRVLERTPTVTMIIQGFAEVLNNAFRREKTIGIDDMILHLENVKINLHFALKLLK